MFFIKLCPLLTPSLNLNLSSGSMEKYIIPHVCHMTITRITSWKEKWFESPTIEKMKNLFSKIRKITQLFFYAT